MARTAKVLRTDLPSDPKQRERVKSAINEMVDSMLKMSAEKEYLKDTVDVLKQDLELDPKYLKKLAKLRYDEQYGEGKVKVDLEHSSQVVEDNKTLFG